MLKKILAAVVVLAAALAVFIAMQPNSFRVARTATMSASPAAVFVQVNDFHNWQAWSPWAKLDPNAKTTFSGPAFGKDAVFTWDGNDEVGKGSMTIVESKPHERIRIQLGFEKPMQDTADVEFIFKPVGEKTEVTWSMSGENDFISKAVCLVMNLDKMIGEDYEAGLANMKNIVEAAPQPATEKPAASQQATEPPDPVDPFKK